MCENYYIDSNNSLGNGVNNELSVNSSNSSDDHTTIINRPNGSSYLMIEDEISSIISSVDEDLWRKMIFYFDKDSYINKIIGRYHPFLNYLSIDK